MRIVFLDNGTRVPCHDGWSPEIKGPGDEVTSYTGWDLYWINLSAPGHYRFTFRAFDGYKQVAPIEFDAPKRGHLDLTIRLQRSS